MKKWSWPFSVETGDSEDIDFRGNRRRKPTVLLRMGRYRFSKRAAQLGALLVVCQILDGVLTYIGLSMIGVHMEGNAFLRVLMEVYGMAPALALVKVFAIVLVFALTIQAHKRRWVRPFIAILISIYVAAAVVPWTYIISSEKALVNSESHRVNAENLRH